MADETWSDHCSLMAKPGGPTKPKVRPADCPKNAAYIAGGDGDDVVKVYGKGDVPLIVEGGRGNDSVIFEPGWAIIPDRLEPREMLLGAGFVAMLAVLAVIIRRTLR